MWERRRKIVLTVQELTAIGRERGEGAVHPSTRAGGTPRGDGGGEKEERSMLPMRDVCAAHGAV